MTSAALQLPNNNPRDYEGLPEELRQEYAKILNLYALKEIERLKSLLSKSRNQNNRLTAELLTWKSKCKEFQVQNERLAGQCQKLGEKKLIRL